MKRTFIIIALMFFRIAFSQTGTSPYPVIFVHGINSDDRTWNTAITQLELSWNLSSSHTLNFVLNARGGDTTDYLQDVIFPLRDVSGTIVNSISNSSIYAINFGNFWNRNNSDSRIILYNNSIPGTAQSPSNQSAIYKQGYALKILIDSVLRVTGKTKVILVGHSMGGLAVREYLQRTENGVHKWWVDPNDTINGHKVARVVTTGTPHLGTNVTSNPFISIDNNSEAMRDMKYSYPSGDEASYMFGNPESFVPSGYYTKDINCNGVSTDIITGLDSNTVDNFIMPLPKNILYTWITANYLGLGTDGAVPLSRQLLYNGVIAPAGIADTLLTNKNHIQETSDTRALIRGLDEPDGRAFAYEVGFDNFYSGFITLQSNAVTSDTDYYKVMTLSAGKISVNLRSLNSGATNFSILSETGSVLAAKTVTIPDDTISFYGYPGNYYLRVSGSSNLNPNLNSYSFRISFIPAAVLNLTLGIEGMWNGSLHVQDTVKVYLRNTALPFSKIDSAAGYLDSFGNLILDFIHAQTGNYYAQVIHRNALETWTSSPVSYISGLTSTVDLTTDQSMAFGGNQVLKSGRWCLYSGDVNSDGVIDATDAGSIDNDAFNFNGGYINTDLTGDNIIDASDAAIADNNASNFVSVMRP